MTPGADEAVSPMVEELYVELRRLANSYLRRERAKSVQATELVHEAYLRLLKDKHPQWQDRTHFLAIAAISMRRLLVERARARSAAKRGGPQVQITLEDGLLTTEAQSTRSGGARSCPGGSRSPGSRTRPTSSNSASSGD